MGKTRRFSRPLPYQLGLILPHYFYQFILNSQFCQSVSFYITILSVKSLEIILKSRLIPFLSYCRKVKQVVFPTLEFIILSR